MKEFITRTITAFFLLAAAYALIQFVPNVWFSLIWFFIISVGAYEFIRLAEPANRSLFIIFLNGLIVACAFTFGKPDLGEAIILVLLITGLYFLFSIRRKERLETFIRDIGIHFLAVFYVYVPLYYMFNLKQMGPNYLFFLIGVIAVGDSGAYFIGKAIGRHKIYPVASPNKSLEGVIAAALTAGLTAIACIHVFPLPGGVKIWPAIVTGAVIGLFSQLSDPIESLFKRAAGKKDSGSILPGHGGVLDRVDSYIFCAPLFFYIIKYLW
ncbi:MAG: phosphatidate cytidylyltransferase [bacterium]|nr:phosphatidate cytidylyltransferase [bacterium]